jgi:hypothetical protein
VFGSAGLGKSLSLNRQNLHRQTGSSPGLVTIIIIKGKGVFKEAVGIF